MSHSTGIPLSTVEHLLAACGDVAAEAGGRAAQVGHLW
jgi:hypothetical protein